jgi:hypothetical protein
MDLEHSSDSSMQVVGFGLWSIVNIDRKLTARDYEAINDENFNYKDKRSTVEGWSIVEVFAKLVCVQGST